MVAVPGRLTAWRARAADHARPPPLRGRIRRRVRPRAIARPGLRHVLVDGSHAGAPSIQRRVGRVGSPERLPKGVGSCGRLAQASCRQQETRGDEGETGRRSGAVCHDPDDRAQIAAFNPHARWRRRRPSAAAGMLTQR